MKYFVAASLLAATVSAAGITDLPPCALTCALSALSGSADGFKKAGCPAPTTETIVTPDAQACLCKNTQFQNTFSTCAQKDCAGVMVKQADGSEKAASCVIWDVSKSTCDGAKIPIDPKLEPKECAAPATPEKSESAAPEKTEAPATSSTAAPDAGKGGASETASEAPAATEKPAPSEAPSYGGNGTASTVATEASSAAASGATTAPTYTPSSASTMVLSGAAAFFAGLVAMLTL